MGCPSRVFIGENLVFAICTHHPDTAALTDADADPIYRLYEDQTALPILTGTLTKLDDANTTGFYSAQVACTLVNGFEDGKTYTVYIQATVAAVTGGIAYGFKAQTAPSGATFPAGAIAFTYTVTNQSTGLPIEGVEVWISTDVAGTNIIWKGDTDALGVARDVNGSVPMLDAGTYHFWSQKSGFTFVNPDTEVVS